MSYSGAIDKFIDLIEGIQPTYNELVPFKCLDRGSVGDRSSDYPYNSLEEAAGHMSRLFVVVQQGTPLLSDETTGNSGYWISTIELRVTYNLISRPQLDRMANADRVEMRKVIEHPNNWGNEIENLVFSPNGIQAEELTVEGKVKGYIVSFFFRMEWADSAC